MSNGNIGVIDFYVLFFTVFGFHWLSAGLKHTCLFRLINLNNTTTQSRSVFAVANSSISNYLSAWAKTQNVAIFNDMQERGFCRVGWSIFKRDWLHLCHLLSLNEISLFVKLNFVFCGFLFYYRCKSKKRERTDRRKLQNQTKQNPIIKSGPLVSNFQDTSCTNTLLSKISVTIPEIFLLYFPDTKHFEEINSIFRDWLASLGNRVYDMSDSKYDEEISKDPESWVMKILMKPNVRILVIDSPVARFSMALASSSTATTSLVSSTASVDSILENNDDEASNVDDTNLKDLEMEDEEDEVRIPLSQKQHHSTGHTLQCNGSSLGNTPLPECALEDSRYELRVFAMKMIQSRFVGKYKQVIVLRYDHGLPHQSTRHSKPQPLLHHPTSIYTNKDVSSAISTQSGHILDDDGTTQSSMSSSFHHHQQEIARKLTPHKQCLVLPQHMPELRSWLRGHGDLYCSDRTGNDGLSDFVEMDNALSPSMTEELPSDEYLKMNGTNILPHFHRYRLTSTSSSQAYTASTTSHPSSPLLSSALESKLRSSLSTSSSSSTTSSSASNNPNKLYSSRKKSTSSATTTSIV